jgi:hypothetical protein
MLTEKQLKQLQPLIKHKKFGPILKEAIKGWKRTTPSRGCFGIIEPSPIEIGKQAFKMDYYKKCCLLGAASLNKRPKTTNCIVMYIEDRFKISEIDSASLIRGFDNSSANSCDAEAYDFANQVSKILIG